MPLSIGNWMRAPSGRTRTSSTMTGVGNLTRSHWGESPPSCENVSRNSNCAIALETEKNHFLSSQWGAWQSRVKRVKAVCFSPKIWTDNFQAKTELTQVTPTFRWKKMTWIYSTFFFIDYLYYCKRQEKLWPYFHKSFVSSGPVAQTYWSSRLVVWSLQIWIHFQSLYAVVARPEQMPFLWSWNLDKVCVFQ